MERTFRLTKRHRNLGVVCLIFFVLVGVASAYGTWAEAPEERRTSALYAATMFGVFWGSFACLACWLLLAYWREELRISDGQVTQQGVTGSKQIDLHSVTAFRWRIAPRPGGSLVLRTLTEKMTIYLGNFEPMERLWLIRFFPQRATNARARELGFVLQQDCTTAPRARCTGPRRSRPRQREDHTAAVGLVLPASHSAIRCFRLDYFVEVPAATDACGSPDANFAVVIAASYDTTKRNRCETNVIGAWDGRFPCLRAMLVRCCRSWIPGFQDLEPAHACCCDHSKHCPRPVVRGTSMASP